MSRTIFISGTGRSGTNILKEVFGRHPYVATLPFETRLTIDPRGLVGFFRIYLSSWSPYMADHLLRDLEAFLLSLAERSAGPSPYQNWELNRWIPGYSELVAELIRDLTEFTYEGSWPGVNLAEHRNMMSYAGFMTEEELAAVLGAFLSKVTGAICMSQQREIFADDNTHSILFASDLRKIAPDSKLIHIVRDPRDVVCSLLDQNWTPNSLEHCVRWYKDVVSKWNEQAERLPDDYYLVVKLEELVGQTEKTVLKLCDFADLSFSKEMMNVSLSTSNEKRYLKELPDEQIQFLERETVSEARQFGYSY